MFYKMKKSSYCNVITVTFKGEGLIKEDTEVADVCGSRNNVAIDAEGKSWQDLMIRISNLMLLSLGKFVWTQWPQ